MPSNQTLKIRFRSTVLSCEDIRLLQGEIDADGYLIEIARRACNKFNWMMPNGEPAILRNEFSPDYLTLTNRPVRLFLFFVQLVRHNS